MTTPRNKPRQPDRQGDDRTQPSTSPGEIEADKGTTDPNKQRGVTTPRQPGRRDRQDPREYPGGSDEDQHGGDDADIPPDPQRST